MSFRRPDPPDSEIAWCMLLHKNYPENALNRLRESYPDSRVVLITDGDAANVPRYETIAKEFRAQLIPGEHLFKLATSYLYVERVLKAWMAGPEQFFLKIDPDARVWRRFSWLPGIACAFGTLETRTAAFNVWARHPPNIQGGCFGATREVVEGILASGLLCHEKCVTNARNTWARNQDCEFVLDQGGMHDDFLFSWAVDLAGFPIVQHSEIASFWRNPEPNPIGAFAITHPHKEMEFSPR